VTSDGTSKMAATVWTLRDGAIEDARLLFGRQHDRVAVVDGNLHAIDVRQQIFDRDEVVRAGGHDCQWVQVEADDVLQDLLEQLAGW
jgi:hypothetical protein